MQTDTCNKIRKELELLKIETDFQNRKKQADSLSRLKRKTPEEEFKTCAWNYLGENTERLYWFGLFLFDPYYTQNPDYRFAEKVLQKGLTLSIKENQPGQASFYHLIGQVFLREGKKQQAKPYFQKAFQLAEKEYPGTIPAVEEDFYEKIEKLLK